VNLNRIESLNWANEIESDDAVKSYETYSF